MDYTSRLRATILSFVKENNGVFLAISEDTLFHNVLAHALLKDLALPRKYVQVHTRIDRMLVDITSRHNQKQIPFVIMEREMNRRPLDQYISKIKEQAPNAKILLLSGEIKRDTLALLFDLGIDNAVIKPLSANIFIEKVANTIKPPAQLGQLIETGKDHLQNGNIESALTVADQVLALKPDSAAGFMLRGDAFKALGKDNEAVLQYESAANSSGFYLGPVKRLVDHYIGMGEPEKALYYMDKLDSLSPLNYERKIDIGHINLQLGREDEANHALGQAVSLAKQGDSRLVGEVATRIANTCMKVNPMVCESHLRTMLEDDTNAPVTAVIEVWNRLGMALRRQGKWMEAVQEYDKAIGRLPLDENLHFNKALALAEGKQFADAADTLDTVNSINDGFGRRDPNLSSTMGRIYHMANRLDNALRHYQDTLFFQPDNSEVLGWMEEVEKQLA